MDEIRTPVSFLSNAENDILNHLTTAMSMYDKLCSDDPQSPLDTFNFGHYIEAARNAVLLRGARRMDPEHLMPLRDERTNNYMRHRDDMYSKIEKQMGSIETE